MLDLLRDNGAFCLGVIFIAALFAGAGIDYLICKWKGEKW